MVKLVDMPDLGSGAARRVGSSPIIRTFENYKTLKIKFLRVFCFYLYLNFPKIGKIITLGDNSGLTKL